MTIKDTGYDHNDLRKQAEKIAKEKAAQMPENLEMSPEEARQLIHELQVHQIELEMQNNELRRAQAELEASQTRYFDFYNLAPVGYFTISEKGVIMEANLTAATLLGITRSALVKQPLSRFILPEDKDIYYLHSKQLFKTNEPQTCEIRMLRTDAAPFWAMMEAIMALDADGLPIYRAVMSDITERRQAEEKLRQAHDELEQRVEVRTEELRTEITERKKAESELKTANMRLQALYNISSLENADNRTTTEEILKSITRMTESECAFYGFINEDESVMTIHGWSGEAMAGCSVVDKPNYFAISESGVWAEAVRKRKPLILNDYSAPHAAKKGLPEGHVSLKNLMVVPLFVNGKITVVAAVANRKKDYNQDDVDQTAAFLYGIQTIKERKLAAAEKADLQLQKTESLSRMAGAIAHHFNNQLAVIIGNLEITLEDLSENKVPVENLTQAMMAARKAAEVSGLMLTYIGQTVTRREPMDICETCLLIWPMLEAAHPKKIIMEADFPSPGPIIIGNKNQLQQVLKNLTANAWESINNNSEGSIRLKIKKVFPMDIPVLRRFPIDWQPKNNTYACLEVADTGCGISGKNIGNLFDPFFSSKFTGRGLGLPVVLGIVRSHDGAITVTSEPGRGSIFCVFLPVSEEELSSPPEKESKIPAIEGASTVLLVEDETSVRMMVMAMLKSLGMTVLEAIDGAEAVEMFRRHKDEIGCVLCDLTMPRMNGWETLAAIRNIAPSIPVILASGYDEGQVMEGNHSEQPDAFLHKPFSKKELADKVREALDRKIIG